MAVVGLSMVAWSQGPKNMVSQDLICKDGSFNAVFPCGLPEDTGAPGQGSYGTGNAFGEINYDAISAGGNETMRLHLHGLQPNYWYLVAMQDPTGGDQFSTYGAMCLFDVKGTSSGFEFCDVALVQANNGGNVNALIPTDSGLTGDFSPVCTNSNVPALLVNPDLGTGSYTGITMVVKNVGVGTDGTAPNCATLTIGGSAELFEADVLPDFTSP